MRSKSKGPKHGSTTASSEKPANTKEKLSVKFNKEGLILGIGVAFFLVTSIISVDYAINSTTNTAIDTAYEALDSNLVYNGVFIEEVNLSSLTKEQAISRGQREYAGRRLNKTFTLAYGNYTKDVTYEDLGGKFDIESTVNEAYKIGRSGSKKARIEFTDNLNSRREYLVSSLSIDKSKMQSTLESTAEEIIAEYSLEGSVKDNFDINSLMDMIENSMLIGEEDIIYNYPTIS